MLEVARAEGHLAEVEDELFRFARAFDGSDELRMALSDPSLPAERRVAVVEDLLGAKALADERGARGVRRVGRARRRPAGDRRPVRGARRQRTAPRGRRGAQRGRRSPTTRSSGCATALGRATGKDVEVKVVVDPTVLGGVVARVGDVVIDGSVRHRLEQLKEQI